MRLTLAHFVGGAWLAADSASALTSVNPSDRRDVIAEIPEASPSTVHAAAATAAEAQRKWRALPGPARAEALYRWSGVLQARQEELAQAMAREVGKPIAEARGEAARGVAILRYYAGEAVREIGEVIPSQLANTLQFTLRDPLGVVGLITPWNFPIAIPLWKAAPALAFGNAVVLKPSELSAHCAALLAETAALAELPPGLFNVVQGSGAVTGEALLAEPLVRGLSFTGSAKVGARVAEVAARRNIRYQTEMGGKNAALVLADADLKRAATLTASGAMRFAGQKCTATSRVIVDRSVFEPFMAALAAEIATFSLGPVTEPSCAIGPLVSLAARERVVGLLAAGSSDARLHCGGEVATGDAFSEGNFLQPTVLSEVAPDSPLLVQELFAPVLVAIAAEGAEDAIRLANETPYGLSATVFTNDLKAALGYVRGIEAGLVRVNGDTTGVDPHAPFGGVKGSSSGSREQGPAAREFYTEIRTVQIG
ncbi:MAG: aldehyde dehydrogenase family protein [Acidobacteriota bacterium]